MSQADKLYVEGIKQRAKQQRLAMAAPELLEACKGLILQVEYLHEKFAPTGSGEFELSRARAAIAKAEGK